VPQPLIHWLIAFSSLGLDWSLLTKPARRRAVPGFLLAGGMCWGQLYTITTIAGGVPPPTPIAATKASIGQPLGVATDAAGNVYIASDNCIFKVDSSGV
jgi:hypothetical protein